MCAQKALIVDEDATGRIVGEVLNLEAMTCGTTATGDAR
jgi:hypothetical protein